MRPQKAERAKYTLPFIHGDIQLQFSPENIKEHFAEHIKSILEKELWHQRVTEPKQMRLKPKYDGYFNTKQVPKRLNAH